MSSPTIEACAFLGFPPGALLAPDTIPAVGLEFVACGGAWPLGHPDYRTGVSGDERLRKVVYRCGGVTKPEIKLLWGGERHSLQVEGPVLLLGQQTTQKLPTLSTTPP